MWDTNDLTRRRTTLYDDDGSAADAVTAIAFRPDTTDGPTLAVASADGLVRMRSVDDHASEAIVLPGPRSYVTAVAFDGDGSTLAAGHRNGAVSLWDLAADGSPGGLPKVLAGHAGRVRAVAFAPDGRTLASAGEDHLVRVWLVHTEDLKDLICQQVWRDLTLQEREQLVRDAGAAGESTCTVSPGDRGTIAADESRSLIAEEDAR